MSPAIHHSKPVALISMPFGGVDRPPVGVTTLKAALTRRGVDSDIHFLNMVFAQWTGPQLYQWLSDRASHTLFAGEWMFASEFFGDLRSDKTFIQYLINDRNADKGFVEKVLWMRRFIRPFLDYCLNAYDWSHYKIVGFTSMFEQNVASLALAAGIKRRFPHITIVFGGANCEGEMGMALHRGFPFIDAVFSEQADFTFPEWVSRHLTGQNEFDVPGVVLRRGDESVYTGSAPAIEDMDSLPYPDFDDFFEQLAHTSIPLALEIRLQIETSRGCWWGAKHHCTFCGLNAETMKYRSKDASRVLAEIRYQVDRYEIRRIDSVDNILDMRYLKELMPALKESDLNLSMFYETKANLTKAQLQLLRQAGVQYIQPGIESFDTNILAEMNKGTSPLQNIQLLKWCSEFGVTPSWNLLYGFPRELPSQYERMAERLSAFIHLPPPGGCGRIRLDRFSPYFSNPHDYGITNIRALEAYRWLYPLPLKALDQVAYFFEFDYADGRDPETYTREIRNVVRDWSAIQKPLSLLSYDRGDGSSTIHDTRPGQYEVLELQGWKHFAYALADSAISIRTLHRKLLSKGHTNLTIEELRDFLAKLERKQLVAIDDDRVLSLAVRCGANDDTEMLVDRPTSEPFVTIETIQ